MTPELERAAVVMIDGITLTEYLKKLLHTLWTEAEGFSGKRPFGDSGWQFDVYRALVLAKVVKGTIDADGDLQDVDEQDGERIVLAVIDQLRVFP